MRRAALFILFALLLALPCRAEISKAQSDALGVPALEQAVPRSAAEAAGSLSVSASFSVRDKLDEIWSSFVGDLTAHIKSGAVSAVSVLVIAVVCALASAVFDGGSLPQYINLAGCLAVSYSAVGDVNSLVSISRDALQTLSDFSRALLPTLCAAAASSGAVTSAGAKYAATALFMDVLITLSNTVIVPLIYAYIVSAAAFSALGNPAIGSIMKLIKWLCVTLMTALTLAFTAYLSITGAVSGAADAAVTKAAKATISAALPVVGGIISDAASSVVAGAGLLRGAIGAFGMVVICAVCAAPFAALGARYLLYKAAAACASALPAGRIPELINGIGTACGMLLGLVGSGAIMLFLSVISSVKAVGL
jgi:stage III sporulation protein AE